MTQQIFKIDGRAYDVRIMSLKRSFEVLDGENTGRTISDGTMYRDVIGTYYNYELEIDTSKLSRSEYDELWQIVSSPDDSHRVTLPYGQGSYTQQMYISSGDDKLDLIENGISHWSGMKLKFVAMKAARTP